MAKNLNSPGIKEITCQPGFQELFLSSPADIVIGGGSAGGGKTYALLMDFIRYSPAPDFGGVIFRRTTPQIRNEGGLWDTSEHLFTHCRATPRQAVLEWVFPSGCKLKFSHLEHEKDKLSWQGSQIPWIGFDELTHFTKGQFLYLLSRNRAPGGYKCSIRATCNPDPESWVADIIDWWIDPETGFPVPERNGVIRYFTIDSGNFIWGDSVGEVVNQCPHIFNQDQFKGRDPRELVKSLTFIRGSIYDNEELLKKDPGYLGSLMAQEPEVRAQLLDGNWHLVQDDLALCDYQKVNDLFTNFVDEYLTDSRGKIKLSKAGKKLVKKQKRYITCDVARLGRDLAVVYVWKGFKLVEIWIRTKSRTSDIVSDIEELRAKYRVSKSDVLVDQDGVGGGVVDEGGYVGFSGGAAVIDPDSKKKRRARQRDYKPKENYQNLKTQCAYKMANRINMGDAAVSAVKMGRVKVDGRSTDLVMIGKKLFSVEDLIKKDMRSFKRDKVDQDGKKRILPKEQQKNILNGRSPDCGDAFIMREFFELFHKTEFLLERV